MGKRALAIKIKQAKKHGQFKTFNVNLKCKILNEMGLIPSKIQKLLVL